MSIEELKSRIAIIAIEIKNAINDKFELELIADELLELSQS